MRVVVIHGQFPQSAEHWQSLPQSIDLTVYASRYVAPGLSYEPTPPPDMNVRLLEPIWKTTNRHLYYVYRGLRSALRADNPDLIHVVLEPWGAHSLIATHGQRRSKVVLHGTDNLWHHGSAVERAARRTLSRLTLAAADGYAGENTESVQLAKAHGLSTDSPTSVLHTNPRSPDQFTQTSDSRRSAARARLGLSEKAPEASLGVIGRLTPEKGVLDLLTVVGSMSDVRPFDVLIAGAGPLEGQVASECWKLGLNFLGALDYPQSVIDFFHAIDVLVHPTRSTHAWVEQGPRVVIEAMMTGCTVVCSNSGETKNMVLDRALVHDEGDLDGLRTAIERALDQRNPMVAERVRAHAVERYSPKAVARGAERLWSRVLCGGS